MRDPGVVWEGMARRTFYEHLKVKKNFIDKKHIKETHRSPSRGHLTLLSTSCPRVILNRMGMLCWEKTPPWFGVCNQICLWTVWVAFLLPNSSWIHVSSWMGPLPQHRFPFRFRVDGGCSLTR